MKIQKLEKELNGTNEDMARAIAICIKNNYLGAEQIPRQHDQAQKLREIVQENKIANERKSLCDYSLSYKIRLFCRKLYKHLAFFKKERGKYQDGNGNAAQNNGI